MYEKDRQFRCGAFHHSLYRGWAMTGSLLIGGAVALVEPAINTVVFFFHEKVWQRRQGSGPDGDEGPLLQV